MGPDTVVRTSKPGDRDAIIEVVLAAFSSADHDGHNEVDIVLSSWATGVTPFDLELVAVDDGAIVGHVLAAWGRLGRREVVALAPLAVSPSRQGVGIGSALVRELLRRAEAAALPLIVVLGDPGFYGRFGFQSSAPFGISYRLVGEGNPHFQVRWFGIDDPSYRGHFTYCWEVPGPDR